MNEETEMSKKAEEARENVLIDKVHIPRIFIPISGYGTITFSYRDFKIFDVKTLTTHNIAKVNKKKFS
jgi:hypothetical protein